MKKKYSHTLPVYRAFFPAVFLFSASFLGGCSSNDTSGNATVTMSSQMTSHVVSHTFSKQNEPQGSGATCDSVVLSRTRFVASNLKLHHEGGDSLDDGTVKTGPFIFEYRPDTAILTAKSTVPTGTYDRVKYEFHKLDPKGDSAIWSDSAFTDFIVGGTYTYIFEGTVYNGGTGLPFVFKSSKTENLQLFFSPAIEMTGDNTYDLALAFDPVIVFSQGGKVLDPRDPSNQSEIEKMVKDAFKALKK
jgi:hypothetical protein